MRGSTVCSFFLIYQFLKVHFKKRMKIDDDVQMVLVIECVQCQECAVCLYLIFKKFILSLNSY